jgi:hypothetical protein
MKTLHYWAVHKKVINRVLKYCDRRVRDIIAADVEQETRETKEFNAFVNSETERLYNDPAFFYNDPYSFKSPL